MIGVRLTEDLTWLVVGAPSYFAKRRHPRTPRDLLKHECIRFRYPSTRAIYRWALSDKGRDVVIDVPGSFICNDGQLGFALARQGLGLYYASSRLLAATSPLAPSSRPSTHTPQRARDFTCIMRRAAARSPSSARSSKACSARWNRRRVHTAGAKASGTDEVTVEMRERA